MNVTTSFLLSFSFITVFPWHFRFLRLLFLCVLFLWPIFGPTTTKKSEKKSFSLETVQEGVKRFSNRQRDAVSRLFNPLIKLAI